MQTLLDRVRPGAGRAESWWTGERLVLAALTAVAGAVSMAGSCRMVPCGENGSDPLRGQGAPGA